MKIVAWFYELMTGLTRGVLQLKRDSDGVFLSGPWETR